MATNTTRRTGFASTLAELTEMTIMALQYLRGRKLRTTLTTLAIVFGIALIFAINVALPGAMAAFQGTMLVTSGSADLSISNVSGEAFAPDQPLQTVAGIKGIKAVTGVLRRQILLPGEGVKGSIGTASQIQLVGVDLETVQNVRQFVMSDGRFLQAGDTGKAVLPASVADVAPQLKVGTVFPLITAGGLRLYTVVGLLAQSSQDTLEITVPLSDAQSALNQPGLINGIEAALEPGADRDAVIADIQKALGPGYKVDTGSKPDTLASIEIGYAILNMIGLLALFLGAFLIFNTFRTVVVERRRDLAMLRAIGATRRQLTSMILIESLIQGVTGTLIGMVVGYFLATGLFSVMSKLGAQFASFLSNLSIMVTPSAVLSALGLGVLTTLLAGYWPARTAGRVSPLEALRPSSTASVQRAARWSLIAGVVIMVLSVFMLLAGTKTAVGGAMLFLVGMVVAAPGLVIPMARLFSPLLSLWFAREGDLARGNMVRQPGRAAITAGTLMIGLASLILMVAVVNSFSSFIDNMIRRTFTSDVLLVPQSVGTYRDVVGADENLVKRIQALPEVEVASGMRYASSTYNGQPLEIMGLDPQSYPKVAQLDFVKGNPDETYTALGTGRNAIVNSLMASVLKLDMGGEFTLQTADGPQAYHVVGIANDLVSMKLNVVFISQANLKADFHRAEDVMLMVNLKPNADKAAALADIQAILGDYPQFTARLTGEYLSTLQDLVTGGMSMIYGVALLILIPAALGLLNTLTINVLERTREIGVVRAVGGSRTQVRRMVTAEALLLGLFGAATGVLAGVAMSYGFIGAFSLVNWQLTYELPFVGILAAITIGVLLALFSGIMPARSAAKLDIIRALQYE
jgi:putative ABC transport system permease protein